MDWLIAFLNKTPAELNVLEAGIMLILLCLAGIGICVMLLKASAPAPNVIRFPTNAPPDERNPFLTDDGQIKPGLIQKQAQKVV